MPAASVLLFWTCVGDSLSTPGFFPPSGTSTPAVITITNTNPAALTYFTLDGTLPGTNSVLYTEPILLTNQYAVLRARAYLPGNTNFSRAVSAYYFATPSRPNNSYVRSIVGDVSGVPTVTISITNDVSISSFTVEERLPGALRPLNPTAGGVWDPANNTLKWGPFTYCPQKVLSYQLAGPSGTYPINGFQSVDGKWTFDPGPTLAKIIHPPFTPTPDSGPIPQLPMPVFSNALGTNFPVNLTLACAVTNAAIRFTTDGSVPTVNSSLYVLPILLVDAGVVRARAFMDGWIPSAAAVAYYGVTRSAPDLEVTRTVYTNSPSGPTVTVTVIPGPSSHCYAVEEKLATGLIPTEISENGVYNPSISAVRWGPFVSGSVHTLSYQSSGLPGTYPVQASWSVDGISASETQATSIVVPLPSINLPPPPPSGYEPMPVLSSTGGESLPATITITSSDTNAVYRYTTDGSSPTSGSPMYTGSLVISSPTTLRVRAFGPGNTPSAAAVGFYGELKQSLDLEVERTISTSADGFPMVTLTATPGSSFSADTCFTVDEFLPSGLTPVSISPTNGLYIPSASVVRWGPFLGLKPVVLNYTAVGTPGFYPVRATWSVNGVGSSEASASTLALSAPVPTITGQNPPVQEPAPVLWPPNAVGLPVSVSITSSDPQAVLRYTLDGSSPTVNSSVYSGPLTLITATTVRTRSFRKDTVPSANTIGYYTPAPEASVELVRTVTNDFSFLPGIAITATPHNVQCYAVTETIAIGLTPYLIGENAVWDPAARVIRWGPFTNGQSQILTYSVSGPSGSAPLTGQGSFDGSSVPILGTTNVSIDHSTLIYAGNTNNGFGGAIGNGRLVLSDDGTNVYGTVMTSEPLDNALVLYLDPGVSGYPSTASFHDSADPLRSAISGYTANQNNSGPGQSVLSFAAGFRPSYAIALQPGGGVNAGGLWELNNGGGNSLRFISDIHLTPVGTDAPGSYRFTFNIGDIGLTAGVGASFGLFGTVITTNGFRSTEAIAGDIAGIQGWQPFTNTAYSTYTMVSAVFPLIVSPTGNVATSVGQTAVFTATAIGAAPLAFQWQLNGTNLVDGPRINGSQTTTLVILDVSPEDSGVYNLVVTNTFGSAQTAAILTIGQPPRIVVGPQSQSKALGDVAQFDVQAVGDPPLRYRWTLSGTNLTDGGQIVGSTASHLNIFGVTVTNLGLYQVIVGNPYGAVTSSFAALNLLSSGTNLIANGSFEFPTITSNSFILNTTPTDWLGGSGVFNSSDHGWNYNGGRAIIPPAEDGGQYADISNDARAVGGTLSTLLTIASPGTYVLTWLDNTAYEGVPTTASYDVTLFDGAGNLVSSNYFSSSHYAPGESILKNWAMQSEILTLPTGSYTLAFSGDNPPEGYDVMVDEVSLRAASIAGPTAPFITSQPIAQTVHLGSTATFSVTVPFEAETVYQWQINGTNLVESAHIVGSRSNRLSIVTTVPGDVGQYRVVVSTAVGSTNSSTATLNLANSPNGTWFHSELVETNPLNTTYFATSTDEFSDIQPVGFLEMKELAGYGPLLYDGSANAGYEVLTTFAISSTDRTLNLVFNGDDGHSLFVDGQFLGGAGFGVPHSNLVSFAGGVPRKVQLAVYNSIGGWAAYIGMGPWIGSVDANWTNLIETEPGMYLSANGYVGAPIILSGPANQNAGPGSTVQLRVEVTGMPPYDFQWFMNGTRLADDARHRGSSSNILSISDITELNQGEYHAVVSNGLGSVTSSTATLTVNLPILNTSLAPDGTLSLSFTHAQGLPYILEWADDLAPPIIWHPIITNTFTSDSTWVISDTLTATNISRYYRLTAP